MRVSACRRGVLSLSCVILLLYSTTTLAYSSRMASRDYNNDPTSGRDDELDDGVSARGYNDDPYEVNVDGKDNFFSREECVLDAGMFGTDEGFEEMFDFYYQVETLPLDDNAENPSGEILQKVETSVIKTLLPSLFVDQCALVARSISPHESHRRLVEMMGISVLPADTVLEGVECEGELSNELNECYVVDGTMTLYSESELDQSFLDNVETIVRRAMTEGDYDNIDLRIVNVSYRESLDAADSSTSVGTTTNDSGGEGSLPVYAWVFIGMGAVTALLALAFGIRRNRAFYDDPDAGSFPSSPNSPSEITA